MSADVLDARPARSGPPPRQPFPEERLEAAYPLGRWLHISYLPGCKNDHARITTDRTTFFLRRSHRSKSLPALQWQLLLLDALRERGLPVPEPLPAYDDRRVVRIGDRLFVATVVLPGGPYDPADPAHLRAAGATLARYHALAGDLSLPDPQQDRQPVLEALRDRLSAVPEPVAPELVEHSRQVVAVLEDIWDELPRTVIHGGCRRGSLLFRGSALTGVLDFDSARPDVRVLDLAIAVHDIGKIYTTLGADDHKVSLDLDRVARFLDAYRRGGELTDAEVAALPALLAAKRAQRALGRAARLVPDTPPQEDDATKLRLELSRLRWLQDHQAALRDICAGTARSAARS